MYKQKYLKYKQKYLELKQLKNLRGGSSSNSAGKIDFMDVIFEEIDDINFLREIANHIDVYNDENSTKEELVLFLNSFRESKRAEIAQREREQRERQQRERQQREREAREREAREREAIARLGARARETEGARKLQQEREGEFQRSFGMYDLDNINITESEIAEAKDVYGYDTPHEKIIDFIKDNKRQEIKRRVESDPQYLRLLTCQIRSTKPLIEEFKKYQENESERYTQLRIAINFIFNERDWNIADARGDGRCMIHSIIHGIRDILNLNTVEINEPFEVIMFKAFKKYFNVMDNNVLSFDLDIGKIYIQKNDSNKTLQDKILTLLNQNTISDELFKVLAIYFNINILQISGDTYQFMFQRVSELNSNNCIIIMQYSGHYRLIYNQTNNITKQKIEKILENKNTDAAGFEKNIKLENIRVETGFWYINSERHENLSSRPNFNNNSAAGGGDYDLERERELNKQRELQELRELLNSFDVDMLYATIRNENIEYNGTNLLKDKENMINSIIEHNKRRN